MALSPEMNSYLKSGQCPRCQAVLLTELYVAKQRRWLAQAAIRRAQNAYGRDARSRIKDFASGMTPKGDEYLLVGPHHKAKLIDGGRQMECSICAQKWNILEVQLGNLLSPRSALRDDAGLWSAGRSYKPRVNRARSIDLAGCRVTSFQEKEPVEVPWYVEKNIYPNNTTKSSVTKEVTVSNQRSRTVTIEADKLKAHNVGANVNIMGFVAIQGQVQEQIGERYSVATEGTITLSEVTRIEIPPGSAVEHVIRWIIVYHNGLAILGQPSDASNSRLAEVPYRVPWRLKYTDEVNDASGPPETKQLRGS